VEDRDWQRLARFYAGEASPEEEVEIRRWLAADPERTRMAESLREAWDLSGTLLPRHHGDARRVWARVTSEIHARPGEGMVAKPPARAAGGFQRLGASTRARGATYLLAAAAILLLVLVPLTRGWRPAVLGPRNEPATATRVYSTRAGERLSFSLADGSVVDLGPNSTLRVAAPFAADRREVQLEGMARFSVVPDSVRPFLVHAGDAVTRVLGTRFVVRAYSSEGAVRVAVVEGRVALGPSSGGDRPGTVLARGQLGQLASGGAAAVLEDREGFQRLVQWTTGRLEFVDRPLSEVLSELETWYDVNIAVPDSELAARPVSTEIEGESLQQVLDLIALAVDARVERSGDTITFTSQ
jgi:transmembrane sensor